MIELSDGSVGHASRRALLLVHVGTRTKTSKLRRHWTTPHRVVHVRLYRLAAEILVAVAAGVFPPRFGWHSSDCPVRSRCGACGVGQPDSESRVDFACR